MSDRFFINMPIPADKYEAVCAVLAGTALATATVPAPTPAPAKPAPTPSDVVQGTEPAPTAAAPTDAGDQSSAGAAPSPAATDAIDPNDIDAHGHPWNPELHAGTKGKTKDGLWRMKVGVTRPDPLPGFPKTDASADTGTSSAPSTPSATSQTVTEPASAPAATSGDNGEDDEFAAFRAAAEASSATDAAAVASVPARQFSDADLGALCNQAAVKLGDPGPIKEIIAKYVPEGQVAHSRNIPTERRDDFAKEVEAKAGIQFAA